jgi:hypothetical protein
VALPQEEWLHLAKRAPVNGTGRHNHLRERRPNLVVRNLSDRYTAYCMACKQGAVLMKEHVRVTGIAPPALSHDLTLPADMVSVLSAEKAVQDGVLGFLAVKHMDMQYLADAFPHFSRQRMRLLLTWPGGWLGRDTTERSPQKWLTFNNQKHLAGLKHHPTAVVMEDPFSFFKVRWALRGLPYTVYSSLGTTVHDELMLLLLTHDTVVFFYDGDSAGWCGADTESKRLRTFGVPSLSMCAPTGKDPKDMTIEAILQHVGRMT